MTEARVSPLQERILSLRDSENRSWSEISRVVSAEFGRQIKRNYAQVLHKRAKAALAGYANIAAKQAEWNDPKNEAQRYARRLWKKLPRSQKKALWRLSPYPPDPVQRALNPPKRARKKTGEALDHAKESLAGLLRGRGNEEGARQVEASIESPPLDEPTPVPVRPEPPRTLPPAAVAAALPVIPPAPKPKTPAKSERKIYVFDWRPIDRSGIFDADGERILDPSPYIVCEICKTEKGYGVSSEGGDFSILKDGVAKPLRLTVDPATRRITAAFAPVWRVPASNEVFNWNEAKSGERPIYRFADGKVAAWIEGRGQWSSKVFRAPDDPLALTDCRAADELLVYGVFRDGDFYARRNGEAFALRLERPCSASGLDYETPTEYRVRAIQVSYSLNPKHPRQSWLPVLQLAPEPPTETLPLPVPRPQRADTAARDLWIAQRLAPSRSKEVKQRDAQRQEERRAEKPSVDLSDPASVEDLYFNGPGFNGNPR